MGVTSLTWVSWAHVAEGDVPPDDVAFGADLSIGGSGEQVSSRTEMVADSAERPEETLSMLS